MVIKQDTFTILSPNGEINGNVHLSLKGQTSLRVIVFAHGYKGFKDWGAWSMLGDRFAEAGVDFVRFNFSHNGHGAENPCECDDLDRWSENNYMKEVEDCSTVIEWAKSKFSDQSITLIGHSRGGGVCAVAANRFKVDNLVLLASVSDFFKRFPAGDKLEKWKQTDRLEVVNGRTGQVLHHRYSFYENYVQNREVLSIEESARSIQLPTCIIHGMEDKAVELSEARLLNEWIENSELHLVENAGHTFNTKHPWLSDKLPKEMVVVFEIVKSFIDVKA